MFLPIIHLEGKLRGSLVHRFSIQIIRHYKHE